MQRTKGIILQFFANVNMLFAFVNALIANLNALC